MLSSDCFHQQQFKGVTSKVGWKSHDFQWALPNLASNCFHNKDGCIHERLGISLSGSSYRSEIELQEQKLDINVLEMKAVKLVLLAYQMKAIHFQIDKTTALSYLVKMGGTKSNYITELA